MDVDLMQWFSALTKSEEIKNRLVFVFALRPFMAEYDARRNLQVLKLLQPITLYHLDATAARALIIEPLGGRIRVDEAAVKYLIWLTSGHPYLIQFILKEIVDELKNAGRATIAKRDIQDFEEKMVSEGPAYEAQFKVLDSDYSLTEVLTPSLAKRGKGVLALIARLESNPRVGWVGIHNICKALSAYDWNSDEAHEVLDQLIKAKILEESDVKGILSCRMVVPLLLKRYVKQNMYLKYFPAASRG